MLNENSVLETLCVLGTYCNICKVSFFENSVYMKNLLVYAIFIFSGYDIYVAWFLFVFFFCVLACLFLNIEINLVLHFGFTNFAGVCYDVRKAVTAFKPKSRVPDWSVFQKRSQTYACIHILPTGFLSYQAFSRFDFWLAPLSNQVILVQRAHFLVHR